MDTYRRRSHRTRHEHRADALADLLARVLDEYRCTVATDTYGHYCRSCAVDVDIFIAKARDLGVKIE
jgi:hypothetical protein